MIEKVGDIIVFCSCFFSFIELKNHKRDKDCKERSRALQKLNRLVAYGEEPGCFRGPWISFAFLFLF